MNTSNSFFEPWWMGISVLWLGARVVVNTIRGRIPRIWFFLAGLAFIYLATEKQQAVLGGLLFAGLCCAEWFAPAHIFYRRLIKRDETAQWGDTSNSTARSHFDSAEQFRESSDWVSAESEYEAATMADPAFAKAWYWLGVARGWQKKNEAALAPFRRLIELQPGSAVAHAGLALSLMETGQCDEADAPCKKALALDPECEQARYVRKRLNAYRLQNA